MRVILLFVIASCAIDHPANQASVNLANCASCHGSDQYAPVRTADPMHPPAARTDCGNCHRAVDTGAGLADWTPALMDGTHPESKFAIRNGKHAGILCTECHDPGIDPDSTHRPTDNIGHRIDTPLNVMCVSCHLGSHAASKMDAFHREEGGYKPARTAFGPEVFCRECHKQGRK